MRPILPLANGLRTDHPVPGLPFVDDSHIPLDDPDPHAIEAVGRNVGEGMWGRYDRNRASGGWRAFTTDPIRHDLAWAVRFHPDHGRSVLLVRDGDASPLHMQWRFEELLFRAGGYWWDGQTWYRPAQVWDPASEHWDKRPVRGAISISAEDLLDDNNDPRGGRLLKVANFDADAPAPDVWGDHLAMWAARRAGSGQARPLPLSRCIVNLSAPELAGDQLIGLPELAELGGVAAATLRAYISRGEGDVPWPQATVSGRNAWAKPVGRDWAEQRSRSGDNIAATLRAEGLGDLPVGQASVRDRFANIFFSYLWERPEGRKRWALRHRNEDAVRQVSEELGWSVAANLDDIVPPAALATTIEYALLAEFAEGLKGEKDPAEVALFGFTPDIGKMLDWFIRHYPQHAAHMIGELVGQAERNLKIPRDTVAYSLASALGLDGKLDNAARQKFLKLVLPPGTRED